MQTEYSEATSEVSNVKCVSVKVTPIKISIKLNPIFDTIQCIYIQFLLYSHFLLVCYLFSATVNAN